MKSDLTPIRNEIIVLLNMFAAALQREIAEDPGSELAKQLTMRLHDVMTLLQKLNMGDKIGEKNE